MIGAAPPPGPSQSRRPLPRSHPRGARRGEGLRSAPSPEQRRILGRGAQVLPKVAAGIDVLLILLDRDQEVGGVASTPEVAGHRARQIDRAVALERLHIALELSELRPGYRSAVPRYFIAGFR